MAQNCWIFGAEVYPNPSLKGRAFLSLPQPLPKGKGFSNFDIRLYMRVYITPPWKCFGRRCVGFVFRLVYSFAYTRCVGFETPQCMVQCIVCAGFETQTIHFVTHGKSTECKVCVGFVYSLHSFFVSLLFTIWCGSCSVFAFGSDKFAA